MGIFRGALACALTASLSIAFAAPAGADPVVGVDMSCVAPAGDPDPSTPEWVERDTQNQYCASLRNRDQELNPNFGWGNVDNGAPLYVEQTFDQASDPTHPRGGVTTLIPGSKGADPFRSLKRWTEAGRGRVAPVSFKALDGATLRGHVFIPPASVPRPAAGYPGVVITDGSVQAYEELYYWAAEDLAEAGYEVMTYDVQGQGDSDLFPENCPDLATADVNCQGVPYQQNYNFFQGAEDSLNFFLSAKNPYIDALDSSRIGLAGHSLGAAGVSEVGQCDKRVKTIVAWDNLSKIDNCDDVTIPAADRSATLIHAPAMAMSNDYLFNTQPTTSMPDPHTKDAGYAQVAAAGYDSQMVVYRGATHLTYTYIPQVFQANELSERMASYYTTAWFDRYLRDDPSAYDRLVATTFDGSADAHSIGTGVYDPSLAVPGDLYSGNVPYKIAGIKVADAMSFYYPSEYSLHDPATGALRTCANVRAGCK